MTLPADAVILQQSTNLLLAQYCDHEIYIFREQDDESWYIMVENEDGYAYDGYWPNSVDKTHDDAFTEACKGAMLERNI